MKSARNLVQLSEFFSLDEFESPDTGQVMLDGQLFAVLDHLRRALASPVVITSGYRTAAHNRAVGGVADSLHLIGAAADLVFPEREMKAKALAHLLQVPAVVVIDEHDHLHVQVRGLHVPAEVVAVPATA
jgi:uncharacterized protein YcbK (DUF882 family)